MAGGRFSKHGPVREKQKERQGDRMNPIQANAGRSITTLSSREVYRNRWMRVREDEILRSNGDKGIYGVVDKDECAIILPIDQGRVWLVEQFRYTIQERALELPQGGWEMEVASPEELARGELKEETGLEAAQMTFLGTLWVAYGFTRQKLHVFLAADCRVRADDARRYHPRCVHLGCLGPLFDEQGAAGLRRSCRVPNVRHALAICAAQWVAGGAAQAVRRAIRDPRQESKARGKRDQCTLRGDG
jgi:8-oxo-dGTP pyrophosphatase MutT (NUDIX family)